LPETSASIPEKFAVVLVSVLRSPSPVTLSQDEKNNKSDAEIKMLRFFINVFL
jgi:hypothetical protein